MANQKMGFEGMLYYGAPGVTASTLIENAVDISVTRNVTKGSTTVRGDSSIAPVETEEVCTRQIGLEFSMKNDSTDAVLEALRAAAAAGTAVALRGKDYASGKGPDGDFTLSETETWNLANEQQITFTATPSRGHGRNPQSYV